MKKVLFVCHGNICRSPMAEFVLKDMVRRSKVADEFYIASAATSQEEIGNGPHPGTIRVLKAHGIDVSKKKSAVQMVKEDYNKYDYLIGMDHYNIKNMKKICDGDPEGKMIRLLDFAGEDRDVDDPWYTNRFEITYEDIVAGCRGLLDSIL